MGASRTSKQPKSSPKKKPTKKQPHAVIQAPLTKSWLTFSIALILLFFHVLAIGELGIVGKSVKGSYCLLLGDLAWVGLVSGIMIGVYTLIAKPSQIVSSQQLAGMSCIGLALSLFAHFPLYQRLQSVSFQSIIEHYQTHALLSSETVLGSGLTGYVLYVMLIPLVSELGIYLIAVVLSFIGVYLTCFTSIQRVQSLHKSVKKESLNVALAEGNPQASAEPTQKDSSFISAFRSGKKGATKASKRVATDDAQQQMDKGSVGCLPPEEAAQAVEALSSGVQLMEEVTETLNQETDTSATDKSESTQSGYTLPSLSLLTDYPLLDSVQEQQSKAKEMARIIEKTLREFNVQAQLLTYHVGPSVTRFELQPDVGVKVNKITSLSDDLSLALAAKGLRFEAPIPGKAAIGIEVPNQKQTLVPFKTVLSELKFTHPLQVGLGRNIDGLPIEAALNKMPHLLVAGATGSGKSVCINTIICSILMNATPDQVKLLLVDPKKVELNGYNGIPHLATPVVTDARFAALALKKVVSEMEYRYDLFSASGTRNIESYNQWVLQQVDDEKEEETPPKRLPYFVVIIDELADLMLVASKDVEESIMRLTQMARAAGIHLIVATQRPSVDVITGVIKANIPSRIAFGVSSSTDSRTILDTPGAEKLLGKGDMLFFPMGSNSPTRVQGAFLSDEEVQSLVAYVTQQSQRLTIPDEPKEDFLSNVSLEAQTPAESCDDPLFKDVLRSVYETRKISTSLIQRQFRIGYNRAARLMEVLEEYHIVGQSEGSKAREVIMGETDLLDLIEQFS